ncbi:uncharacterized protein EI90DRAFT_3043153 [Cantharellus anzutake]|uniref:uncharacterized protein n=1 Tax=Cantharellus anzutake TaxID=1750568 RepID=UPI0019089665|nr:uncharacterized protein EI90DRAFT_3043153 [Cantharellus anzutake]KAF8337490.1 hypothetical protein EI90DRAFT_3043153 [Cantharellus anzutake]
MSSANGGSHIRHQTSNRLTRVCPHFSVAPRAVRKTDAQFYCLCTASFCFRCGSRWTSGVGCMGNSSCDLRRDVSSEDSDDEASTEEAETSSVVDTRPFCSYCSRRFKTREALKAHIENVTSHPVRKCCGRKFVSEEAWEAHSRAKHWN